MLWGNLIRKGGERYLYNHSNRLRKALKATGETYAYIYNAQGQRVEKREGSKRTRYVYDLQGQLMFADGATDLEYVYLNGQPLAQINAETGAVYYYHNDHLGTPQKLTDQNQAVVWEATYDPFGKASVTTETVENNVRFPGQYFDEETQLHYNWFRYYDSEEGRYITSDPIGLDGGLNTYVYVNNNPINSFDFQGLRGRRGIARQTGKQSITINASVGAGGAFQAGPVGMQATTSIAIDTNGNICLVTHICSSTGTAMGIFGSLGLTGSAGTGPLCEGKSGSAGVFAEAGIGAAISGSIAASANGAAVGRGIIGIGGGGAGGILACFTRTICFD